MAVAKKCDTSVNAFVTQNDSLYFWVVIISLICIVVCRVALSFMCAEDGLAEDGVSSA